jgi:hypothetical protein
VALELGVVGSRFEVSQRVLKNLRESNSCGKESYTLGVRIHTIGSFLPVTEPTNIHLRLEG